LIGVRFEDWSIRVGFGKIKVITRNKNSGRGQTSQETRSPRFKGGLTPSEFLNDF